MPYGEILRLIAALAAVEGRPEATRALVERIGARALYVLVPHPDVPDRLIPAPGFASTVPGGTGWRELMARSQQLATRSLDVAWPGSADEARAVAYTYKDIVFVVVGHDEPRDDLANAFETVAPLVAAMLTRERELFVLRGELAIAHETTQRANALATAVEYARAEAERATRVKDEFLAMLGHELRNPLAPIVTALQMLKLEGQQTRIHDILERQVSHMLRLVDDLLDVSRITRGKIELRRAAIELGDVVARAMEQVRPMLEAKRNQLVLDVPMRGLVVDGDPARLAQVVANLVTNAAKYSDGGTKIEVRAERAGGVVRLSVEDQGIGLAPEMLDRVFDQFVQVPQASDRAAGGLGLGLAIVRSLVKMHGGSVRAFSEGLGKGCTFTVELPAIDQPAILHDASAITATATTADTSVLIVDDNHDAAELLGQILESFGYAVRIAHDGPEALAVAPHFRPAVALLDIGLPVMDGYELGRALRAKLPDIHLVAITGYGQVNDRERALNAGFQAHLIKPVSIGNVTETLDKLLQR
jgi:signal transduction histidine kinase